MQSSGMIMVDPMQNASTNDPKAQQNSKKNRKNRKKNKNKTEEENVSEQNGQPKIVTLRNPLFQGASDANRPQPTMPLQQRNQVPLNINQPASIIKNDNGMFTIRNMALHQALSNGVAQNYRPYSSEMYQPPDMKHDNYSYFPGNDINNTNTTTAAAAASNLSNNNPINQDVLQANAANAPNAPKPSHTAIGSERLLRKQQQSYSNMNGGDMFNNMHMEQKRPFSSFNSTFGFNSDFIGASKSGGGGASRPASLHSQYYHVNGGFSFNNQPQADNSSSLFGSRTPNSLSNAHCCDDQPPTHDHFGTKTNEESSFFKKFDDDSFLHGLHPGQRLNSEVNNELIDCFFFPLNNIVCILVFFR